MKVLVNSKETVLAEQATVSILKDSLLLPEQGVAIAVNNKMIPRAEWDSFSLKENDNIVIIKAACGG